jgi:hypothetical protein
MNSREVDIPSVPPPDNHDELTGLPVLRTWTSVYYFVFVCFVLSVLLLLTLTVVYS